MRTGAGCGMGRKRSRRKMRQRAKEGGEKRETTYAFAADRAHEGGPELPPQTDGLRFAMASHWVKCKLIPTSAERLSAQIATA